MNNLIKEKIRGVKEEIKVLTLKKESLNDKVKMQEEFYGRDRVERERKYRREEWKD